MDGDPYDHEQDEKLAQEIGRQNNSAMQEPGLKDDMPAQPNQALAPPVPMGEPEPQVAVPLGKPEPAPLKENLTPPPAAPSATGKGIAQIQQGISQTYSVPGTQSRVVTAALRTHGWTDPADRRAPSVGGGVFYDPGYAAAELGNQKWDRNSSVYVDQRLLGQGVGEYRDIKNIVERVSRRKNKRLLSDREYLEKRMGRVLNAAEQADHQRLQAMRALNLAASSLIKQSSMEIVIMGSSNRFRSARDLFKLAAVSDYEPMYENEDLEEYQPEPADGMANYYAPKETMQNYMFSSAPSEYETMGYEPEVQTYSPEDYINMAYEAEPSYSQDQYASMGYEPEVTFDTQQGYSSMGYEPQVQTYSPEDYISMGYSPEEVYSAYSQMYASPEAAAPQVEAIPDKTPEQLEYDKQLEAYNQSYNEIVAYLTNMGYSAEEAQAAAPQLLGQVNISQPVAPEMPKTASLLDMLAKRYTAAGRLRAAGKSAPKNLAEDTKAVAEEVVKRRDKATRQVQRMEKDLKDLVSQKTLSAGDQSRRDFLKQQLKELKGQAKTKSTRKQVKDEYTQQFNTAQEQYSRDLLDAQEQALRAAAGDAGKAAVGATGLGTALYLYNRDRSPIDSAAESVQQTLTTPFSDEANLLGQAGRYLAATGSSLGDSAMRGLRSASNYAVDNPYTVGGALAATGAAAVGIPALRAALERKSKGKAKRKK